MKYLSLMFILIMACVTLTAQTGKVYDNLSLNSTILKGERKFALYLPPDYESSQHRVTALGRTYPFPRGFPKESPKH